LLGDQIGLPLVFLLVLHQARLRADDGRFRGDHFELVRLGLDGEQRRALFDEIAIGIADRLHETLHARDQINRVDGRRIAGRLVIARDVLRDGRGNGDLGRRRGCIFVILAARGDARSNRERKHHAGEASGSLEANGSHEVSRGHWAGTLFKSSARTEE
jgi:hypothetical protein